MRPIWSTGPVGVVPHQRRPDAPFGQFLSKGQTGSINDLFTNELGPEWTFPRGAPDSPMSALIIYVCTRILFLVVGITLPLPCGVFAPLVNSA